MGTKDSNTMMAATEATKDNVAAMAVGKDTVHADTRLIPVIRKEDKLSREESATLQLMIASMLICFRATRHTMLAATVLSSRTALTQPSLSHQ